METVQNSVSAYPVKYLVHYLTDLQNTPTTGTKSNSSYGWAWSIFFDAF